jgi:phosphoglycolate phosphatase-like HAD superfamily hydrolase
MTGDENLGFWKGKADYFKGVDIAMEKIMPNATPEERTIQARKWYQEGVVKYIREHNSKTVYNGVADILRKLKKKYTLALVTVNALEYIEQILEAAHLTDIYDIIYAIPSSEKPDKADLFKRFVKEHGTPRFYIAARSKEAFEECLKLGELCVYVAWDEFDPEIACMVKHIARTPQELEEIVVRTNSH